MYICHHWPLNHSLNRLRVIANTRLCTEKKHYWQGTICPTSAKIYQKKEAEKKVSWMRKQIWDTILNIGTNACYRNVYQVLVKHEVKMKSTCITTSGQTNLAPNQSCYENARSKKDDHSLNILACWVSSVVILSSAAYQCPFTWIVVSNINYREMRFVSWQEEGQRFS